MGENREIIDRYDWGGYESELTFWGVHTAEMVRQGAYQVASQVKPQMEGNNFEPIVLKRRT